MFEEHNKEEKFQLRASIIWADESFFELSV